MRSRLMLGLAYDGALRREELCRLRVRDVDADRRLLRVPEADGPPREVRLSPAVAEQCEPYLRHHRARPGPPGQAALFLSESPRNRAEPISIWTWSKVVQAIARRAGVEPFTTHTPRHLRLTDLARLGLGAREIARFAGLATASLARRYLRLASAHRPDPDLESTRQAQLATVLFGRPTTGERSLSEGWDAPR
jgi:integrase